MKAWRLTAQAVVVALLQIPLVILGPLNPSLANSVTYSESFTVNQAATTSAANAWATFRTNLTGTYDQITISNNNGQSITVTDSVKVQEIANRFRSWNSVTTAWTIGASVVTIGDCGSGPELTIGPSQTTCNCFSTNSSGYFTVRPQIGNSNWGGAGVTCSAASQTLSVTFRLQMATINQFTSSQTTPTPTW